jgi:hypothetical protein
MNNNEAGLALSLNGWVEGHVGKGFVTQRYMLNLWKLFYNITLIASRFVNNYRGKMGILSITLATHQQYSQKLCDIYVTISDAQKLSTS